MNTDRIPLSKAIAIIVSVITGAGFLMGCGLYFCVVILENVYAQNTVPPANEQDASQSDAVLLPESSDNDNIAAGDNIKITLSFAGDCTLGSDLSYGRWGSFVEVYETQENPTSYFFSNVLPIFESDDLTVVNLEGPLTTSSAKADKTFAFKGAPQYSEILVSGSIELVNMANNHTYDYGASGFNDTVTALDVAGVSYYGAGKTFLNEINGIKVAVLGYTAWGSDKAAKNVIAGDIKSMREQGAKIVAVTFHGGTETVYEPNQHQKILYRHAIDSGADVVVGHHPHVIQGIEFYNGKYIAYSLGNFSFGGNRNPKDKDTLIFQQTFNFDTDTLELRDSEAAVYPCSVSSVENRNNFQPTPLYGAETERVIERLRQYSLPLNGYLDVIAGTKAHKNLCKISLQNYNK